MKPRAHPYGDKNISDANIERLRKEHGIKQRDLVAQMQLLGVDINPSSLSKLEGQYRVASDFDLCAIATVLGTTINELVEQYSPDC